MIHRFSNSETQVSRDMSHDTLLLCLISICENSRGSMNLPFLQSATIQPTCIKDVSGCGITAFPVGTLLGTALALSNPVRSIRTLEPASDWGRKNVHKCNRHILDVLELSRQLIIVADEGERDAEDDSCVVLYGVVRDCAYRMRCRAEQEREAHIARGIWDSNSS